MNAKKRQSVKPVEKGLQDRVEKLEEALGRYANPDNWHHPNHTLNRVVFSSTGNGWEIAEQALTKTEKASNE